MSAIESTPEIVDLGHQDLERAAEVLASAFFNDPLTNFILADLGKNFPGCLREFFRFTCEIRLELDWPLWGVVSNGRLQGVACLSLPEASEWPSSLVEKHQALKRRIGRQGSDRLEKYSQIVERNTTDHPHVFFGALGVHPRAQSLGLGSLLIKRVSALAESLPTSTGVALDTEKSVNVSIYRHFGYRVTAQEQLEDVKIWCMFRPNESPGEP